MFQKLILVAGLMLCCVSQSAFADKITLSKQFSTCLENSRGVTRKMLNCIGTETKKHDVRLNKAYKAVMPQLSPKRKKQLRNAQRAWIKYRDANCNFYANPDGGSIATVSAKDCFMSATASRATELESFKE